jgi:hypothetical protein
MQLKLSDKNVYFFFDETPSYAIQSEPPYNSSCDIIKLKQEDTIEYLVNENTGNIDILIKGEIIDSTDKKNIDNVKSFVKNWNDSLKYINLDDYLSQHQSEFLNKSKLQKLKLKFFTWNLAGRDINSLEVAELDRFKGYGLLNLAFQEFIPLTTKSQFISAKSIDATIEAFLQNFNDEYEVIKVNKLFGMVSVILVNSDLAINISDIEIKSLGTGFLNYGNKGAVLTSIKFNDYRFYFVNCHLCTGEASQALIKRRNELFTINSKFQLMDKSNGSIVINNSEFFIDDEIDRLDSFEISSDEANQSSDEAQKDEDTLQIEDSNTTVNSLSHTTFNTFDNTTHDPEKNIIFVGGDLNYRLNLSRDKVFELLRDKNSSELLEFDSLRQERQEFGIFQDFKEGNIHFLPTYRFPIPELDGSNYDEQRTPAYTDRILHSDSKLVKILKYDSIPEFSISDHKPVFADYEVSVPFIDKIQRKAIIEDFHTFRAKKVNENTFKNQLIIENLENVRNAPILRKTSMKLKLKNVSTTSAVYFSVISYEENTALKQKIDVCEEVPFEIKPLSGIIPPQSECIITVSTTLPIGVTEFEKISILRINDTKDFFITTKFIARKSFFGSTLYELTKESNGGIPKPLYTLINYLTNNIQKDIFSGEKNDELEKDIVTVIDTDGDIPPGTPVSIVADVLIILLKNLDGGIVPTDLATFLFDAKPDLELEDLLEKLPPLNVNILIYLTSFLGLCYEGGVPINVILEKFQQLLIEVPTSRKRDIWTNKVNYEKLRSNLLLKLIKS